jgi:hypothetical protein
MKTADGMIASNATICQKEGLKIIPINKTINWLKIIFDNIIAELRDSFRYSSLFI